MRHLLNRRCPNFFVVALRAFFSSLIRILSMTYQELFKLLQSLGGVSSVIEAT